MLHTSVRLGHVRMVVLIVLHLYSLLLPCFILQLGPSWSYGSSYCVTLVFTTITMLHTSVCHGRDRMVVLIVLHLYSLLLPCFIFQSVVVMIVNRNYHAIMTTTDWSMKHGNSSEYKRNTIRTTIRSRPRQTEVWSMVIVVNTSVTQ
jgi:hypothetical protein